MPSHLQRESRAVPGMGFLGIRTLTGRTPMDGTRGDQRPQWAGATLLPCCLGAATAQQEVPVMHGGGELAAALLPSLSDNRSRSSTAAATAAGPPPPLDEGFSVHRGEGERRHPSPWSRRPRSRCRGVGPRDLPPGAPPAPPTAADALRHTARAVSMAAGVHHAAVGDGVARGTRLALPTAASQRDLSAPAQRASLNRDCCTLSMLENGQLVAC